MVVYNTVVDNAVRSILNDVDVCGFTEIDTVKGKGCSTGFHLGTPVFPDINNLLFIIDETEKLDQVVDKLKALKEEFPDEGIKLFTVPVEEL